VREQGLAVAGQIATKTGARLIAQFTNARMQRGHGCVSVDRMPYVVDQTLRVLAGLKHIVLVGSNMLCLSRQAEQTLPR
jgi:acetolactate synthase-1/2/3 large subunit